ncbi:MAG: N-acyl homoserine lactonase family protein [Chloroflexota bacterium]
MISVPASATAPGGVAAAGSTVRRVGTFSTGLVRIHPEHAHGSRLPAIAWMLLSRRWEDAWRPIQVYVVEHEDGPVLFDAGQDPASVSDPEYYPDSAPVRLVYDRLAQFDLSERDTVTAGLRTLGYDPRDVRRVVLSHLHQDHIGGLRELTHATFVASEAEIAAMRAPRAEAAGYLPRRTDLPGAAWQAVRFGPTADPGLAPFDAAHDLLGDGSLVLLPTPGHTSGSLSMLVRGPATPLLLVGDLTYDVASLATGEVPGVGSAGTLRATSAKVLELSRRLGGAAVLPAHDPSSAARLAAAGGTSA